MAPIQERTLQDRAKLIVTIDTEEDDWGAFRPTDWTLRNIEGIPDLQRLFDSYGVMPTYLVTYSVATGERTRTLLSEIVATGRCEIGAHCHPWHTPPLEETPGDRNSMLCNLPPDLQRRKLQVLHETIQERFGFPARSFRSGRWGYGPHVARALHALGYSVDSSVTPYVDWTSEHGPDFSRIQPRPFRFSPNDALTPSADGPMLEVPATIGFAQTDFPRSNALYRWARERSGGLVPWLSIVGRLRMANRIWLSPEVSTADEMVHLARVMLQGGHSILNMVFHSTTLTAGLTPFTRTKEDVRAFLGRIERFLEFARASALEPIRLSDASRCL